MSGRLHALGFFVLLAGACQKDKEGVDTGFSAGSGYGVSAANGSGGGPGSGGAAATGSSTGTVAGTGGATGSNGSGGDGGASPSVTSGSGGGVPDTCGDEVACWGDEPSLCDPSVCGLVFIECAPDEPSAFADACGDLLVVLRGGIWAHVVDCMRAAGPDVECEDGEAAVETCLGQARAEACASSDADGICESTSTSCPGFDEGTCKEDLKILNDSAISDYALCVLAGGDCATLHDLCFYG